MPRPATGVTPVRNLRVKDEVWVPALDHAKGDGTTITNVITRFLERYNAMTAAERLEAAGLGLQPSEPDAEIRADIRSLNAQTIRRLAAKAEEAAPDGWAQRVAAGVAADERPYLLVAVALDEEYLTESQIPH
jgi:hypothetical protein